MFQLNFIRIRMHRKNFYNNNKNITINVNFLVIIMLLHNMRYNLKVVYYFILIHFNRNIISFFFFKLYILYYTLYLMYIFSQVIWFIKKLKKNQRINMFDHSFKHLLNLKIFSLIIFLKYISLITHHKALLISFNILV